MRSKLKGNKLFRTWLLIQICFLAFMTIVIIIICFYTNHHIKNQLDELHLSNLKRMEAEVNTVFGSVVATVNEYIMNPKIRTLTGADLSSSQRDIAELVDDIKQTNSAAKGICEIIIYFENDGIYVSSAGVMDKKIFNDIYSNPVYKEESNLIINKISEEDSIGKLIPIYNGRNDTYTAIYTEKSVNGILISAVIDRTQIENILDANLQSNQNAYCIFSSDQELIYWLGNNLEKESYKYINFNEDNQSQKIEINNQQYIYLVSSKEDIKYVFLINEKNYLARQLAIQRIMIIILAVSTILGAGISYYITRYKYKPVENVINISKAITPEHVFASSENELEQIKNALEFIYGQKEQAKSVLDKHNIHIKNNAVKMLIDGDVRYQDLTNHMKSLIGFESGASYTVVVMEINSHQKVLHEIDRLKEYLPNIKHIFSKGGRIIMIFKARADDVMLQINIQSFIDTMNGTAAIGEEGIGPDGVKLSYNNALLSLSRKILPNAPKIILQLETKEAAPITISTENEIRLGGHIQSGDTEKALVMLKELTQEHGINNLNYFSYKTYLFNISNIIIRSAESVLSDDAINKILNDFGAAFEEENYLSISKTLNDAVIFIAEQYKEKMNSRNKYLNDSIVLYIDNKISDSQLSSDSIAETMNLNSAYLRRFFKEQNGITLWDFINMKRIEMAKNLLITTNSSIKNISLSCGYISISTFVRMFKKFSGMTPGHYRNLYI